MSILQQARIIVGVAGGIAAYKVVDVVSKLNQAGALVDVVLTETAREFVSPLTFSGVSQRQVWSDLWEPTGSAAARHIELASAAQVILIAPATANTIARLAHGFADDMLSAVVLASGAPVIVAPAMEHHMYVHAATQANIATLRDRGVTVIPPDSGRLASGEIGMGRLPDTQTLIGAIRKVLGSAGSLRGKHVVVTAGGTQEPIDPVRYIGNRSSGKQGFAIAQAAVDRGAQTTLVAGVTDLPTPFGVTRINTHTAQEMRDVTLSECRHADILVMCAAVADFTPIDPGKQKIKKQEVQGSQDADLILRLRKTSDILGDLQAQHEEFPHLIRVGFAAEPHNPLAAGLDKLQRKGLDMVVVNDVTDPASGFGSPTNRVWLCLRNGKVVEYPLLPKPEVAERIFDAVSEIIAARQLSDA